MRLVIDALLKAHLLVVPGASAIVFPEGLPVESRKPADEDSNRHDPRRPAHTDGDPPLATDGEGNANSVEQLKEQGGCARPIEAGPNLLTQADGSLQSASQ